MIKAFAWLYVFVLGLASSICLVEAFRNQFLQPFFLIYALPSIGILALATWGAKRLYGSDRLVGGQ